MRQRACLVSFCRIGSVFLCPYIMRACSLDTERPVLLHQPAMVYFSASLSALMGSSAALMSTRQRNVCVEEIDSMRERVSLRGMERAAHIGLWTQRRPHPQERGAHFVPHSCCVLWEKPLLRLSHTHPLQLLHLRDTDPAPPLAFSFCLFLIPDSVSLLSLFMSDSEPLLDFCLNKAMNMECRSLDCFNWTRAHIS